MEEIKRVLEARGKVWEIEVRGPKGNVELLSLVGPVYVMSEDQHFSLVFPHCILFIRIFANDYIVAY